MGLWALTARTGNFQPDKAKSAEPAALPAAGQNAVNIMSNQKAALSQVFPL